MSNLNKLCHFGLLLGGIYVMLNATSVGLELYAR